MNNIFLNRLIISVFAILYTVFAMPYLCHSNDEISVNELAITGIISEDKSHPIIYFPYKNKIFESKIVLTGKKIYEVFVDNTNNEFIITSWDREYIEIFVCDILSPQLPKPIYSYKHNKQFLYTEGFWFNQQRTLCITGYISNNEGSQDDVVKIIQFDDNQSTDINLREHIGSVLKYNKIGDYLFVTGELNSNENGKEEKNITIDIKTKEVKDSNVSVIKNDIFGNFDDFNLGISKNGKLFSFDGNKFSELGKPTDHLLRLYGKSNDGSGYYATIVRNSFWWGEHTVFTHCPFDNPNDHSKLYQRLPWNLFGTTYMDVKIINKLIVM